MKKINDKGFMLIETLIVTSVVAGILIFLFMQFSNLNKNYNYSYSYNTVEGLYAAEDIKEYIESDTALYTYITQNVEDKYIDLSDCSLFTETDYCQRLFELEDIKKILVAENNTDYNYFLAYDVNFLVDFIKKIKPSGTEKYRLIVAFNNKTYATIKFGV